MGKRGRVKTLGHCGEEWEGRGGGLGHWLGLILVVLWSPEGCWKSCLIYVSGSGIATSLNGLRQTEVIVI